MPDSKKPRFFQAKQPIMFGEHLAADLERGSDVNVVFTTWAGTQAALKMAGQWTRYLEARVVVWFLEVVPRQFALRRPPLSVEFTERRLANLAVNCCDGVDVEIRMCLCTDFSQCLMANLKGLPGFYRRSHARVAYLGEETSRIFESAGACSPLH